MGFERACALSDVAEHSAHGVTVGGRDLVIARTGDEVFAVAGECSHQAVSLSGADVDDCRIECFLHGSTFDLRSGAAQILPATEPIATYPVEIRGDDVYVDATTSLNGVTQP